MHSTFNVMPLFAVSHARAGERCRRVGLFSCVQTRRRTQTHRFARKHAHERVCVYIHTQTYIPTDIHTYIHLDI